MATVIESFLLSGGMRLTVMSFSLDSTGVLCHHSCVCVLPGCFAGIPTSHSLPPTLTGTPMQHHWSCLEVWYLGPQDVSILIIGCGYSVCVYICDLVEVGFLPPTDFTHTCTCSSPPCQTSPAASTHTHTHTPPPTHTHTTGDFLRQNK